MSLLDQPNLGDLGPDKAQDAKDAGYWEGLKERAVKTVQKTRRARKTKES